LHIIYLMKQFIIALLMLLPMTGTAQENVWDTLKQDATANVDPDAKYLVGAVPEVDGRVVWQKTVKVPGKTAAQLYDQTLSLMQQLTKAPGQLEQSRVTVENKENGQIVGSYQEWLVFKSTALVLDRTRLLYHLIAECKDGEVDLKMTRIIFIYDEERTPQTFRAEEWITDRYGLKRDQKKLSRVSGKFRRKTIDRKDYLFEKFDQFLSK